MRRNGPVAGQDGLLRCPWAVGDPLYLDYHDTEWGVGVRGEPAYLERLTLEAFQSGLSWLTILRKRPAFREVFAGFDAEVVAGFGPQEEERLMQDPRIVRNRRKIQAAVTNARAALALRADGGLEHLVGSFRPPVPGPAPASLADLPAATAESAALSKTLKRHGFVFVGPTTMYALMQAVGLVDDHLAGCFRRGAGDTARTPRRGDASGRS